MIARPADGGLVLVAQRDHAALTAPLARAWRWHVPRREDSARACGAHDDGWAEWDAAPTVDERGAPHSYRHVPDEAFASAWRHGFDRAWADSAWVGLLVSLHGSRFVERREHPECRALAGRERVAEREALAALGHPGARAPRALPEDVARAFALLAYLDGLSLFLCEAWDAPWRAPAPVASGVADVTAERDGDVVRLDPWPFATRAVRVEAPARALPAERFESTGAYRRAIAVSPRVTLAWRLAPAP